VAVSQQPWVSIRAEVDSGPEPTSGEDDLVVGVVRMLVVGRDEVGSARLSAELRPLDHVVSAVGVPSEVAGWLERRAADVLVLFARATDEARDAAQRLATVTDLPLIVVGPDASAEGRASAFDRGAQDYIVGPVSPSELDRRVRVLVRRDRLRRRSDELVGPQGLVMHVRSHEAYVGSERLAATPKEFAVLQVLLERRGEVVVPDEISLDVWGYETYGSRNFVEAHISRLRAKLRRAGTTGVIKTVRGVGYVIR